MKEVTSLPRKIAALTNHGIPKEIRIAREFDPIAFEIPVCPRPLNRKFKKIKVD